MGSTLKVLSEIAVAHGVCQREPEGTQAGLDSGCCREQRIMSCLPVVHPASLCLLVASHVCEPVPADSSSRRLCPSVTASAGDSKSNPEGRQFGTPDVHPTSGLPIGVLRGGTSDKTTRHIRLLFMLPFAGMRTECIPTCGGERGGETPPRGGSAAPSLPRFWTAPPFSPHQFAQKPPAGTRE
jgi:hypothetical protein